MTTPLHLMNFEGSTTFQEVAAQFSKCIWAASRRLSVFLWLMHAEDATDRTQERVCSKGGRSWAQGELCVGSQADNVNWGLGRPVGTSKKVFSNSCALFPAGLTGTCSLSTINDVIDNHCHGEPGLSLRRNWNQEQIAKATAAE